MNSLLQFLWPIEKKELKKFLPMALISFFTIFNYNALRSVKETLVVPSMGAESITFIKVYLVTPSAILLFLLYAKLSNRFSFKAIYYQVASFYVMFFILFGFILLPNASYIHPSQLSISQISDKEVDLMLFSINLSHFKWFFTLYQNWMFGVFYVLAEFWNSTMTLLLFYQLANKITLTDEAKRFYPMFALVGSLGNFVAGTSIKVLHGAFSENGSLLMIQSIIVMAVIATFSIMFLFRYINANVLTNKSIHVPRPKNTITSKKKIPLKESFKIIFSSKYLGMVVVLVISYGVAINLLEGPWKAEVRKVYPGKNEYLYFMATLNQANGLISMIFMLVGATILKKYSWFTAAIITPLIIFVTGIAFFSFVVFGEYISILLGAFFMINPAFIAVILGMSQNVLSKSTKYALFDPTKEMTYIPIDEELKSKGKAAVDVVGARFAKSFGAFVQSTIFILFPAATYSSISWFLMIIFAIVAIIWILDVKILNKEYLQYLNQNKEKV
ncbi:MAG: Npt1/Npt2 family nucleotide transporter [Rickettsiales bacterium]